MEREPWWRLQPPHPPKRVLLRGKYQWSNTAAPSQDAPQQPIEPQKGVVASIRPVFRGFCLWLPIHSRGLWAVLVLS